MRAVLLPQLTAWAICDGVDVSGNVGERGAHGRRDNLWTELWGNLRVRERERERERERDRDRERERERERDREREGERGRESI